jgi:hypothetical protein
LDRVEEIEEAAGVYAETKSKNWPSVSFGSRIRFNTENGRPRS